MVDGQVLGSGACSYWGAICTQACGIEMPRFMRDERFGGGPEAIQQGESRIGNRRRRTPFSGRQDNNAGNRPDHYEYDHYQ